ncbi:MAG: UbiA family prenyltransferase [Candidatus Methanofastidiosia archaeon]|jgi:4-hydroxybenzoate polyprenyltransferase
MPSDQESGFTSKKLHSENTFKLIGYLARSRVDTIFVWSWNTAVAGLIAKRVHPPVYPFVLSVVAMAFIAFACYLYNDITDTELDKLNPVKKRRPLPSLKVSKGFAVIIVGVSAVVGLGLLKLVNVYSFVFGLIFFVLFSLYSYPLVRLKKLFLVKELVITIGFPLTSFVGMYAVADTFVGTALVASLIIGFFCFMAQPALGDTTDIKEDRLAGGKTLAMVFNWDQKIKMLVLGTVITLVLVPVTYVVLHFNVFLPAIVIGGGIIFLWLMVPIMRKFDEKKAVTARKVGTFYLILLQIAFVIGSISV